MLRDLLHRAIPSEFNDPVGLAARVLRSGPDGRFAVLAAALGVLATPFDLLAESTEERAYDRAESPRLPMLFVCGPPRSGTTVVALALARSLDVAFVTNLTSIFPRAPITMSRLFRARPNGGRLSLRSHYGRTRGMLGWNDGLHLWDRWLGNDRTAADAQIDSTSGREMEKFFGAYERWSERPLLMKNNGLIFFAPEVARYLPTASFLCLQRDPVYLAQSLLVARSYIHGDEAIPYGRDDPGRIHKSDAVEDVCEQVRYYEGLTEECRTELGPDRFRVVSYEEFCADPARLVNDVGENILGLPVLHERVPAPLNVSTKQGLPDATFARLESLLGSQGTG